MTLLSLDNLLKTVCPETYELAAPAGAERYIVWRQYGSATFYGDNSTVLDIPRVQLDIVWKDPADTLPDSVKNALELWCVPYEVQDHGYDDEYAAMRCIISVEVF